MRGIEANAGNEVAVTIDDSPHPGATPFLLDLLDEHNAQATFFVSGFRAINHIDLVKSIHARGHAIYAHGWEHVRLDRESPGRLTADMARCEALLSQFRPTPTPYLVRLPYNGGYRNARIHRELQRWSPGCQIAHWRISTEDHGFAQQFKSQREGLAGIQAATQRVLNHPHLLGAALLLHDMPINQTPDDGHKAWLTCQTLKHLLEGLTAKGLRSVALRPWTRTPPFRRYVLS